jgi:hypothetical protein
VGINVKKLSGNHVTLQPPTNKEKQLRRRVLTGIGGLRQPLLLLLNLEERCLCVGLFFCVRALNTFLR